MAAADALAILVGAAAGDGGRARHDVHGGRIDATT
jgi:hypothetical protein